MSGLVGSNKWKGHSFYLLVDVERIDICHAADEIDDRHDAGFQVF